MGGELEVTLARQRVSGQEVERLGVPTDDLFCLRIRDSGFGMSPETLQRAFEPFFTTRTQIKAAGLGLTIVHGITLFHGGQIELQSIEDQGTVVTVWIPAEPPRLTSGISSGLLPQNQRKRRVLLIEDDPLIKEVLRTWLVRHDLDVESAANEIEARRSLARSGEDCVLVFIETDLQSGRGEDLYLKLSREYATPAWVFLSGSRTPRFPPRDAREEPLVIKKPFSHNAFSDLVRKYANR
jgi:CheY-like chemotaxis protein